MDDSHIFQTIRGKVRGQSNGNMLACLLLKGANTRVQDLDFPDPGSTELWQSRPQYCMLSDLDFNISYQSSSQSQSRELQHQENINYLELYPASRPAMATPPSVSTTPPRESSQVIGQPTSANMAQSASLLCPRCSTTFTRLDTMKRHLREKHRDGTKSTSVKEYSCPHGDCNRSKKGSGFGRKEHLHRHLRKSCKSVRTQQQRASSQQPRSEFEPVTPTDDLPISVDHEPSTLAEHAVEQPRENLTGSQSGEEKMDDGASLDGVLLAGLKTQAEEERSALDAEKEMRRKRKNQLRRLEALISELEEN